MRRMLLWGTVPLLVAFLVVAAQLGTLGHRYDAARDRATATATGTVVRDGIGDEGDVEVTWRDAAGEEHRQRFGIYDTDRYVEGAEFRVRYDPRAPSGRAFPGDPEETSQSDDYWVPLFLCGFGVVLVLAVWGWRWLALVRARRRPAQDVSCEVLDAEQLGGGLRLSSRTWLALTGDKGEQAWQRVAWDPALERVEPGAVRVTVRGDLSGRRRVHVTLPDGSGLVSVGRLRQREPGALLEPREPAGLEEDALLVVPALATLPPPGVAWRRAALLAGVGAAAGLVPALVIVGSAVAVLPMCAGFAGAFVTLWALGGAEP